MYASELISDLQQLMSRHGDIEVTVAVSEYEYSASSVGYTGEGPLPKVGNAPAQELPDRIVIGAKDDLEAS